jgi:hypothetical protein
MAIDTRQKRASAIHVSLPWRGLLPLPDGAALTQADRQQTDYQYSGILADPPVPPTPAGDGGDFIIIYRRRRGR